MTEMAINIIKQYVMHDNVRLKVNEIEQFTQGYHEVDHSFNAAFQLIESPYSVFEELKKRKHEPQRPQNTQKVIEVNNYNKLLQILSNVTPADTSEHVAKKINLYIDNCINKLDIFYKKNFSKRKHFISQEQIKADLQSNITRTSQKLFSNDTMELISKISNVNLTILTLVNKTSYVRFDAFDKHVSSFILVKATDDNIVDITTFENKQDLDAFIIHEVKTLYNLTPSNIRNSKLAQLREISKCLGQLTTGSKEALLQSITAVL
jgi:hypothetical protein